VRPLGSASEPGWKRGLRFSFRLGLGACSVERVGTVVDATSVGAVGSGVSSTVGSGTASSTGSGTTSMVGSTSEVRSRLFLLDTDPDCSRGLRLSLRLGRGAGIGVEVEADRDTGAGSAVDAGVASTFETVDDVRSTPEVRLLGPAPASGWNRGLRLSLRLGLGSGFVTVSGGDVGSVVVAGAGSVIAAGVGSASEARVPLVLPTDSG